jgi:hypothetical protein
MRNCVLANRLLQQEDAMNKTVVWARNALALVGILALGFWLGSARTVKAESYGSISDVQFQLAGVNEHSSLLVYQPESKTVFVYQGATTGNSSLQCSYMFKLDRPGSVIRRINCPVSHLTP